MADIDYEYAHGVACAELAKAKAEIERLRAALAEIIEMPLNWDGYEECKEIARRALEQGEDKK